MKLIKLLMIILFLASLSCKNGNDIHFATPENPVFSPSGKYILIVTTGFDGIVHFDKFSIAYYNPSDITHPQIIFSSLEHYRNSDALFFFWGENDTVWVYSGDTGTFYWEKQGDNWIYKGSRASNNKPLPKLLLERRPFLKRYEQNKQAPE